MFKTLCTAYLLCLLLACLPGYSQNSVTGEITNLRAGNVQLILEEDINRKKSRLIAEIPVDANGKFNYAANLSPNIYSLKINNTRSVMLAIDGAQKIFIKGDLNNPDAWEVTGSSDTRILFGYESFRKASLARLVYPVRRDIGELKKRGIPETDTLLLKLTRLEVDNYERHREELMDYVKKEMGTSVAVYATSIRWNGDKYVPFLSNLSKEFELSHPGTAIAARLDEKVKIIIANSTGGKVADIKMPDKDSVFVHLSSVKSRYTLIDFWASWCLPCRKESPLLNELYGKYKTAGLQIFAVGLDTDRNSWIKAIEKDKRTWINVSSLEGFETPACFDYGITSLPSNVLIDASGKVVAKNLRGEELREYLEKLFTAL